MYGWVSGNSNFRLLALFVHGNLIAQKLWGRTLALLAQRRVFSERISRQRHLDFSVLSNEPRITRVYYKARTFASSKRTLAIGVRDLRCVLFRLTRSLWPLIYCVLQQSIILSYYVFNRTCVKKDFKIANGILNVLTRYISIERWRRNFRCFSYRENNFMF